MPTSILPATPAIKGRLGDPWSTIGLDIFGGWGTSSDEGEDAGSSSNVSGVAPTVKGYIAILSGRVSC